MTQMEQKEPQKAKKKGKNNKKTKTTGGWKGSASRGTGGGTGPAPVEKGIYFSWVSILFKTLQYLSWPDQQQYKHEKRVAKKPKNQTGKEIKTGREKGGGGGKGKKQKAETS